MHKKLSADLNSLAHSILTMKNKEDVFALKQKAHEIYEKLSLLAYVEEYINTTPQATETKEELLNSIKNAENNKTVKKEELFDENSNVSIKEENVVTPISEDIVNNDKEETATVSEDVIEQPFDEIESIMFADDTTKNEAAFIEETKAPTLEEELKDTISVDVTADLFTKVTPTKSLNDKLQSTIQIGLNDRIAFVKHLFNGNTADFSRVVSQLSTFNTEQEAKNFIAKTVKPDYNWREKEEYETRLLEIIERRFL